MMQVKVWKQTEEARREWFENFSDEYQYQNLDIEMFDLYFTSEGFILVLKENKENDENV